MPVPGTVTVFCRVTVPAEFVALSVYCVVTDGETTRSPAGETWPIDGLMLTVFALVTSQASVVLAPAPESTSGVAVKLLMTGTVVGPIVTVAARVDVPEALVALKMYVVVCVGFTVRLVPVTVPPGEMLRLVALLTVQLNVDDWPAEMDSGVARKAVIAGDPAGPSPTRVTRTVRVTLSEPFHAVRV